MTESPVKISQIIINNFQHFRNVELKFGKYTSINGKFQSAEALQTLVQAIKFVLDCSELPASELEYSSKNNARSDGSNCFVAASINDEAASTTLVFCKSIVDRRFIYTIDNQPKTQEEYKQRILATQTILPNLKTLVIDTNKMEAVSTLNEKKRIEVIELLCGSQDLVKSYDNLVKEVYIATSKFVCSRQRRIELEAEKKKVSKEIESVEEKMKMVENYNEKIQQYSLFRLFQNEKFDDTVEVKISEQKKLLQNELIRQEKNFEALKMKVNEKLEFDTESKKNESELLIMNEEIAGKHWEKCTVEKKVDNFKKSAEELKISEKLLSSKIEIYDDEIKKLQIKKIAGEGCLKLKEKFEDLKASFNADKKNIITQHDIENQKILCNIDEVKILKEGINLWSDLAVKLKEDSNSTFKKINLLKKARLETQLQLSESEIQWKELEQLKKNAAILSLKVLEAKRSNVVELSSLRAKTIAELKQKFRSRVFGRLSEFWTAANEEDRTFIEKRLGKFNHAIIVDNKVTASACIGFLKMKLLAETDETFLPLNELPSRKTKVKFPANFRPRKIETLVTCLPPEMTKAVIHCLTPSVVCETLKDAKKAIAMAAFKKVNVMSKEGALMMKKEGTVELAKKCVEYSYSAEEMIKMEKLKVFESEKMLLASSYEDGNSSSSLLGMKIKELDMQIKFLEKSLEQKTENQNFYSAHLKKVHEELGRIEEDEDRVENMKELNRMERDFAKTEEEYFGKFCIEAEVENVKEFQETLKKVSTDAVDKKIRILKEKVNSMTESMQMTRKFAEKLLPKPEEHEKEIETLEEVTKCVLEKKKQIHDQVTKVVDRIEVSEMNKEIHEKEQFNRESVKKISESYEKIYDDLNRIQENLSENFEIFSQHFFNQINMSLKRGTLEEFIMPRKDLPEDFHPVKDQLKLIEANFENLEEELKKNVGDVTKKTLELRENVEKVKAILVSTAAIPPNNVKKDILKQITDELKIVKRRYNDQHALVNKVKAEIAALNTHRKRIIDESLETMNGEIKKFYESVFDGRVTAKLEQISTIDFFENGIAFNLETSDFPSQKITETSENYTAALAFLFGIFKVNRQKFVILSNATRRVSDDIQKFFNDQDDIQIINFTSRFCDETSDYTIRFKSQGFVVARVNK